MNEAMVVVLYLRLSVEDYDARIGEQDESNSITAQRNILRDFVAGREEFQGRNCWKWQRRKPWIVLL